MSPRFASDDIDEVREKADIVEVISEHVRLKRAGRSYKGLCPFHQEKTPSLSVEREKGVYYCYGCGAGGSVFTFVEQIEGLSFPEAVESLARRFGVELREVSGQRKAPSPRARLLSLHEAAVDAYRQSLADKDAASVRAYVEGRGLTQDQLERHQVGFGGWRRDGLTRRMLRRGFTAEELTAAGLASRGEGRTIRDTFAGRLLFPIFDIQGRPVGFGGRVLPIEHRPEGYPEGPKYLNSRETSIFKKSRTLYGANWARGDVVRAKRLVIVEGYTDVIALHACGVGETVATCGTSLTEQHMKEISTRFGDVQVVLCLDADAAGQAAMSKERTEELAGAYSPGARTSGGWLPVGRGWLPEVSVATLPEGKDPADFADAEGGDGVRRVLDRAMPLVEFLLRRAIAGADLASPQGRATAVRRGVVVLAEVGDPLLRHEFSLWLADRAGVDPYEVTKAAEVAAKGGGRREATMQTTTTSVPLSGHHRVEREALRILMAQPKLFKASVAPTEDDFTLPVHRSLYRLAATEHADRGTVDVARLATRLQDEDLRRAFSEIAVGEPVGADSADETLIRLRSFTLERRIVERKERLRALDPDRESAAYDALFEELLDLERERRALGKNGPAGGHGSSEA